MSYTGSVPSISGVVDSTLGGDILSTLGSSEVAVTTTANLTVGKMHVCSGTSSDYTVTLPAASGNAGKFVGVRMATGLTKLVTVDGNGSETVDGSLAKIMWAGESAILQCDGSSWFTIAGKQKPMEAGMYQSANQLYSADVVTLVNLDTRKTTPSVAYMEDTTNKRFYIPRPGTYLITIKYSTRSTNTSATRLEPRLYKDISLIDFNNQYAEASSSYTLTSIFLVPGLVAGDYLSMYFRFVTGSYTTSVLYASTNDTFMTIKEVL